MKRTAPTGGVKSPIPQLRTTMIPNWIGSIPQVLAIGRRIGVAIKMIGAISMIHPKTRRIRFKRRIKIILFEVRDVIAFAAISGIWRYVRQYPKTADVAIRIRTIESVFTHSLRAFHTLILCPNVSSVHQWIRELLDKTTLTPDQIGEYSGETKTIKPVTVCTYQVLTYRTKNFDKEETEPIYPHFSIFSENNWGLVIYDEVHMLPAPVFRITAELQSIYRLGLTATLIREDGREDEVFSLVGPKRFDTPWAELTQKGFIAKAYCHEVRIPLPHTLELEYALAPKKEKYRIASQNPLKIKVAEAILKKHEGESILIIGQYLEQLQVFRDHFGYPIITGTTSNKKRDELYDKFRSGEEKVMIVSKVANFAVDLPDASVAIEISGSFGSRQEEAQRLGRILRPKARDSHFYTIVTEYSQEEEFASNRQKFLSEQGYSYSIIKEDVR